MSDHRAEKLSSAGRLEIVFVLWVAVEPWNNLSTEFQGLRLWLKVKEISSYYPQFENAMQEYC